MNKNISLYKKLKLFWEYKKIIKEKKEDILQRFGAKVDSAYRIYYVINIPVENVGEPYNLRKTDIDRIAETSIREYSSEVSKYLNENGLGEMYDFYEVSKVDKYSYLIVIGFSLFKSNEYYDKIRFRLIPISLLLVLVILLLLFI